MNHTHMAVIENEHASVKQLFCNGSPHIHLVLYVIIFCFAGDPGEKGDKGPKGYGLPGHTGDQGQKGTTEKEFT